MPRTLAWLALAILSAGLPHAGQNRSGVTPPWTPTSRVMLVESAVVAGKRISRSYNNTAALVGNDANLAPVFSLVMASSRLRCRRRRAQMVHLT